MATLPTTLELSISLPGLRAEGGRCRTRGLNINEEPSTMEEGCGDHEDSGGDHGGGSRSKKLRLSKEQSRLLEESFRGNHTLNAKQKEVLAFQLGLKPRQVEVWFQNRRARTKLKQTEMECEYLKRCFGSLTEENKRLQREVEQLRALKSGPPINPTESNTEPSMLTMCPRCERVTTSGLQDKGPANTRSLSLSKPLQLRHSSRQRSAAC